ncbi:nitroreductase family deazaflavin-dependent oxidoreductase [Kribbella sp. NPDC051770]|uniref:nitroreductase family deazaflavin-dependent oxidoreductase n=1 Tax=Kribbella sp. NPDC051770 TaxID=3155413 RepID=UPI00342A940B
MGLLTPLAVKIGSVGWMPRLLPQITWVDKLLQRGSCGRWSLLRVAGLPNLMLVVAGRKSGVPRSTPLLCVPYRNGYLIAGSNFGGLKEPVWVVNVRAADRVTVVVGAERREAIAREVTGEERAVVWEHMVKTWPNYALYAARTDRMIPVFFLEPVA